ncbi:hypothetical protein ACIGMX_34760 [Streptomyces aquilus]|uniref:hypothetical protein n=1 Tax=Streptomyces aquilus TaxID=2548456 RepID=UPI0037D36E1D
MTQPDPTADYRTTPPSLEPTATAWQAWWEDHDMWDGDMLYADLDTAKHHSAVAYIGEEYAWLPGDDPDDEAPDRSLAWELKYGRWRLLDNGGDTGVRLAETRTYASSAGVSPAPDRADVGTEFVRQVDQPDEAGLTAFEADLASETAPGESWPSRRAGLRDDIAAALYAHDHPDWRIPLHEADVEPVYVARAAAVLPVLYREWPWLRAEAEDAAVLPASVDRADVLDRIRGVVRRLAAHAVGFQDVLDESDRGPWGKTVAADIDELRRVIDEHAPLSPFYEHPECGFRWHGRDGMDIPVRDGQPVCPRCELAAVEKRLRHSEKRCDELRAESKRRGKRVLEHSEELRALERSLDEVRQQLGGEILRTGQAEAELRRVAADTPNTTETRTCDCPSEDAPEHMFSADGCTCRPWTRQTTPPRYLDQPGDTVDMISGWKRGADCPHHAPAVPPAADQAAGFELRGITEIYAAALTGAADFFRGLRLTGTSITAQEAETELRRLAAEAAQQNAQAQARRPLVRWHVERRDHDGWVPASSPTADRARAAERLSDERTGHPDREFRLARATTTYVIEPAASVQADGTATEADRATALPALADRAAALQEGAVAVAALKYDDLHDATEFFDSERDAWNVGTLDAAALLHRLANEPQPATARPDGA